jgi:hypothetical protein
VRKDTKLRSKLKEKGTPVLMVGYAPNHGSGTYRVYKSDTKRIIETRDVIWQPFVGRNMTEEFGMFETGVVEALPDTDLSSLNYKNPTTRNTIAAPGNIPDEADDKLQTILEDEDSDSDSNSMPDLMKRTDDSDTDSDSDWDNDTESDSNSDLDSDSDSDSDSDPDDMPDLIDGDDSSFDESDDEDQDFNDEETELFDNTTQ